MKLKMLKLLLFFLTVGLLSSSKETGIYAHGKCNVDNAAGETSGSGGGSAFGSDIEKPITPGNFLYFY